MAEKKSKFVVRTEEQIRALAGPLQNQIVGTLERVGPSTAKELAVHVGVAPESLYYHLRKLKRAGLLLVTGRRPTSRRPEAVYALPGRELVLDATGKGSGLLEAAAALQRSLLGLATRLYERALRSGKSVRRGAKRNLCVIQVQGRLRPAKLAELNRRLEDVAEFVAENDDPGQAGFVSVTISMSPVTDP